MNEEIARLSVDETSKLGKVFRASGYFKNERGPIEEAQAIVKILYGQELGFSPVVSMMGIQIIQGKPELSANMLATLVKQHPVYDYKVVSDPKSVTECEIEFMQNGEVYGTSLFTMEDAKTASLAGGVSWKKYPKAMLFARAMSQGVRTHCPDVAMGVSIYVEGEISGDDKPEPRESPDTAKTDKVNVARHPKADEVAQTEKQLAASLDAAIASGEVTVPELLPKAKQINFNKEVRRAASERDYEPHEIEDRRHVWLKHMGHVDPFKEGSTAYVPEEGWMEVRDMCAAFLASDFCAHCRKNYDEICDMLREDAPV